MLDSVPLPVQAVFWPLLGAAIILILNRILPDWLRRLVALSAALASLAALWSLRSMAVERVELSWPALNLFRMSPTLQPDSLSLLTGLLFAAIVAATVLGIRSTKANRAAWPGLVLLALAGCLAMTMSANLLTLALGSAILDLTLVAMAVVSDSDANRVSWRMAVPGTASTIVLVLGTLQMDSQLGTASLLARNIPQVVLLLLGMAGVLRVMVFPMHPRGLETPHSAATLLLVGGAGIFLLARMQALAPVLAWPSWAVLLGGAAMAAGGLLAWTGAVGPTSRLMPSAELDADAPDSEGGRLAHSLATSELARAWAGAAVHQAGYAVVFVLLLGASLPWPLIGMMLALGLLAIWWDSALETAVPHSPRWLEQLMQRTRVPEAQARSSMAEGFRSLTGLRTSRLAQVARALFPAIALASLAGVPLTVGALGRWQLYGILLYREQASLLIITLFADTLLAAGLWMTLGAAWKQAGRHRPRLAAMLSMLGLAILVLLSAILLGALEPVPAELPTVSVWGVGLVFVLPWLVGGWLARVGPQIGDYLRRLHQIFALDWLYRAGTWIGLRLAHAVHWLGQVGEGEGWWGWALIILTLAIVLLTAR